MAEEGLIQLALDGAGKKVKSVVLRGVPQTDGTVSDLHITCAAITDADGNAIDFAETNSLLRSLLGEMQALRKMYGRATGQTWTGLLAMEDDVG